MDGWKSQRGEEKKWEDQRRERVRGKRQVREKVGKSRFIAFFRWSVAPEGRKVGSLKRRVRSPRVKWEMKNYTPFVARSTFGSQKAKNTPPDHFWKLRCRKKCMPLWREADLEVKMYKTHHARSTFGSCDVENVHAVVARSTCPSQNVENTPTSDHFWKFRCRKSARRCGAKHISKSKCTKHPCTDHFWFRRRFVWQAQGIVHQGWARREGVAAISTTTTSALHYTTLHYTTLHYTTLHSTTRHDTTRHYTTTTTTNTTTTTTTTATTTTSTMAATATNTTSLRYTRLHYTILVTVQCTTLVTVHHTTIHSTTLHFTTFHYTTLHCTTQDYTTLHYPTLHYTWPITPIQYNCKYTTLIAVHHNYNSTTLQLQPQLHYTTLHPAVVGEVTTATIATTPKNTTPTSFQSSSGFALPSVIHNNQPLL